MEQKKFSLFEQFLFNFNALKDLTSGEPSRLKVFYGQHEKLTMLTNKLYDFMVIGNFERQIFHTHKKYHLQTPAAFMSAYKDYNENWQGPIKRAVRPPIRISNLLDLGDGKRAEEIRATVRAQDDANDAIDDARAATGPEIESPDPEYDERFNPLAHDGAAAFGMAFDLAKMNYRSEGMDEAEEILCNMADISLEAYDYLTETIGFDANEVFRRWRNVPVMFIPEHVSNKYGIGQRGSLFDLIDDAIRAYVFGAHTASVSACKAVLEMTLKKHYDVDSQHEDEDGLMKDRELGELIVLASEKCKVVRGGCLEKYTLYTNKSPDECSAHNRKIDTDEQLILELLKTLKSLLEHAPVKCA